MDPIIDTPENNRARMEETTIALARRESQKVADTLTEALKMDPDAIHAMIVNRVPVGASLVQLHPHVLCASNSATGGHTLDALGLVNAALLALGLPPILLEWSVEKDANDCPALVGFVVGDPMPPFQAPTEEIRPGE